MRPMGVRAICLCAGVAALLSACGGGTTPERLASDSAAPRPTSSATVALSAQALCDAALHGRTVTAQLTTLGEARRDNFGGPYPGIQPAGNVFPGLPDDQRAAWCWASASTPESPPTVVGADPGSDWALYVATGAGEAQRVFTEGGMSAPPTGPPSVP